ncbi:MAG: serine hydrolase [Gemmatimonadota bacterium]
MPLRPVLFALILLSHAAALPAQTQSRFLPKNFDAYVAKVLARFKVPGVAIAVVQDGQVLLAKGYGVKTLGKSDPVTPRTPFAIASNSKLFTASALGMLVDEGKLKWDDRVIDHLPWFRMSNPYVTAELTIRDLLTHRSGLGLGAGDLLIWPSTDYNREDIARRLANVPLATSFRSSYAYDNVLYLVAGEVIKAVSGLSWEEFVGKRMLPAIGMRDASFLTGKRLLPAVATPHAEVSGRMQVVEASNGTNTNPAGGILASAEDLSKWLLVQLDSGRTANGKALFSPAVTRQLWQVVTPMPVGVPPAPLAPMRAAFNGYALGLNVRDWRGQRLLTHTGGLAGFVSRVAILPGQHFAIAVLTNAESGAARDAIAWRLVDHAVGEAFDWLAAFDAASKLPGAGANLDPDVPTIARDPEARPSLPLAKYAGSYEDAWYGKVTVTSEASGLVMRFTHTPGMVGDLTPWGGETFVVRWRDRALRADAYVTFELAPGGKIAAIRMAAVSPAVDFSYDFQDLLLKPVAGP